MRTVLLFVLLSLLGLAAPAAAEEKKTDKKEETHVFELRTYYAALGKMDALQARFRDHTNQLFEKHHMKIVGFWVPTDSQESQVKLIYILAHPSREAAEANWKAFQEDPEWQAVKKESEKDGKLVEKVERVYLKPTDFSPIK